MAVAAELRTYYDLLPDAVLVYERGVWIYANPAARRLLGVTDPAQILERSILEIVPGEDHEAVMQRVGAADPSSQIRMDQRIVCVDGGHIMADLVLRPAMMSLEPPAGVVSIRDVSDRVELAERFRATFEQAAVGIAHVARGGAWIRVNQKLCEMSGYSRAELESLSFRELAHSDDLPALEATLEELRANPRARGSALELRFIRKNGIPLWTILRVAYVRDVENGEPYVVAVVGDISQQKSAEEALRIREARFRGLIQNAYDLILVLDASGGVTYVSDTIEAALGYTPDELYAMNVFSLVHPDDLTGVTAAFDSLVRRSGARVMLDYRIKDKRDGWRRFETTAVSLLHDPAVGGIVVNTHDVSERERLREEVEQMRRVESLGRVAASITHEFNNLLMAVSTAGDVIARNPSESARASIAKSLKTTFRRGRHITAEILRFAQPAQLERTEVELGPWLRDVLDDLRPLAGDRHALRLTLDEGLPHVSLDRNQMAQVVTNLVLNARDASPPGPIDVTARHSEDAHGDVVITVADCGAGIAPELHERIFEPMFTTKKSGTGLGLSIVQQIVVRHGGRIRLESEVGKGTRFLVTLPAQTSPARPTTMPSSANSSETSSTSIGS